MPVTSAISPQSIGFPTREERRRSPRRPHTAHAVIASPTGGRRTEVACFDLSKHGVGLTLTTHIPAETFHVLELGLGEQKIVTEIHVLSCHRQDDGTFRVHAEFC